MTYFNKFVAVIKTKGKILRERENNTVYLPFGSEYSIFLKNLNSQKALVKVDVDGKSIGADLIINSNSSVNVERFIEKLDRGNRFKFIQKTKDIVNHRGDHIDDGIVRIEVFYEKVIQSQPIIYNLYNNTYSPWQTFTYKSGSTTDASNVYSNTTTLDSNNACFDASVNSRGYSTGFNHKNLSVEYNSIPNPEEGITVRGSESHQHFVYGSIGILEEQSDVIVFQLRGYFGNEVKKQPITVKTKLVCSTCGKHNKSNMKYCPTCGTYLKI